MALLSLLLLPFVLAKSLPTANRALRSFRQQGLQRGVTDNEEGEERIKGMDSFQSIEAFEGKWNKVRVCLHL